MKLFHKIYHSEQVQQFMNNSVLMNWSTLNKSILILALGGIDHILWIGWYLYCFFSPHMHFWFDPTYFNFHLTRMTLCGILSFLLIIPCYFYRDCAWVQRYLPYIATSFFSISFIYGGYSIGIISPATIAGFISILTVGLVLFERKIVYLIFLPISLYIPIAIILSALKQIPYSPVFSEALQSQILYRNEFWVYSQLYLYIPIFFACIVLFEILLTQWRKREQKIDELAQIDPLTGIFNRRKISHQLKKIQQEQIPFALILLDLDYFKSINDQYGHEVGDQVLKRVAQILSMDLDEEDMAGRFGGEEFILILNNKNLEQALNIAERYRHKIASTLILNHPLQDIYMTASFGIAVSNPQLSNESIIRQADQALYFAKNQGRNQVRHWQELDQTEASKCNNSSKYLPSSSV